MRLGMTRRLGLLVGPAAIFATTALGGCAPDSGNVGATFMADRLKYELYDCKQMENQMNALMAEERRLRDLIARAEQDTGGAIVAAVAYKTDYAKTRADMKVLGEAQQRRDCIKQTERDTKGAAH